METINNVIENHLQGAGGHVHLGYGAVHHVNVGLVEVTKMYILDFFS